MIGDSNHEGIEGVFEKEALALGRRQTIEHLYHRCVLRELACHQEVVICKEWVLIPSCGNDREGRWSAFLCRRRVPRQTKTNWRRKGSLLASTNK
jgi:hypothetical protein